VISAVLLHGCATRHQGPPGGSPVGVPAAPVAAPAPAAETPRPADGQARFEGNPVVASYDGREIRSAELGQWFLRTYRREALAALSKLVGLEMVEREARRIGLTCPQQVLDATRLDLQERLQRDAAVAYGIGADVKRFVQLRYQQSVDDYLDQRLEEARQRWLFSRIIRLEAMRTDRVELAMIVTKDLETIRDVERRLQEGADFGRVAGRFSVHESKSRGGMLPPLPREALNPAVASRAFEMTVGERSGILDVDDGRGRRQFEIFQVRRRFPGRDVGWTDVAAEIEAGLEASPVSPMEWTAWYLRLERVYNVRVFSNL